MVSQGSQRIGKRKIRTKLKTIETTAATMKKYLRASVIAIVARVSPAHSVKNFWMNWTNYMHKKLQHVTFEYP